MCWINLSPLCVALTRQSSGFMADWICVIKDDKQNHLLVISICHRPAFAISRTSLKNNSEARREREKREREGAHTLQRLREKRRRKGGGGEQRDRSQRVWVSVNEGAWGDGERGKHSKKKEETDGDFLLPISEPTCWCCAVLPTDSLIVRESVLPVPTSQRSNLTQTSLPLLPRLVLSFSQPCLYSINTGIFIDF